MAATAADLFGRERELAAIAAFLEANAAACAVLIEGEPGIGKTAVWEAAVSGVGERALRTLLARPGETESKLAFSGLTDLLGEVLPDALAELPPPQRRALEVALLLDDDSGVRVDRRAVSAGLLGVLRALAAETPVLVAIDDVQWLDRSSAVALGYATRRLGDLPVALLVARRRGNDSAFDLPLAPERVLHVSVGPLEFVPLNALLHARLGTILPRPQLHRVHELSGGNPFFALELARDPARIEPGRGLPPTLDVLVRDRISALPEEAQTALLVAAAASHPTAQLVDRVTGTRDALAAAEAAQIVFIEHGIVRFDHPLLVSGAYGAADPARRREVHLRLARTVRDAEEGARHLAAAATGQDEKVALALDEGAVAARARGAPAAAAELSELAARLTPPDDDAASRRRRADAGYFHFESGDSRQALAMLGEVVAELPAGPERAEVLIRLARVRSYSDDLQAATDLFLQAADEAADDGLTRARALEGAATQLFRRRTQLEAAVEHAKAAAAIAEEVGAEELVAEALSSQVLAEATLGRPEAHSTVGAALAHGDAAATGRILARPAWVAAVAQMWWDEPAAVRGTFEDLVERGRELGDEGSLAYVYVSLAQADVLLGDLDRADADAAAARDIAEQGGQETLVAYALAMQAVADAHRGRDPRPPAERALELGRRTQGTPAVHAASAAIGLFDLTTGRAEAAAGVLGPLVEYARTERIREPGLTRFAVDYVEALVELGRLDQATDVLNWFEESAERLSRRSALAASARGRGLLAGAAGRLDDSLASFERALREHEAVPLPFDRARTLLALGTTLRRAKRKADARRTLEEAVAAFDSLGAEALAARGRSELERIGGRKPSRGALTATERQIAELVAEGRSNKEVAATLFVSVKTVEANLSRTYAKLGIRSRAGLARHLSGGEAAGKT